MKFSSEWVIEYFGIGIDVQHRILLTVAAFVFMFIVRFFSIRIMLRRVGSNKNRYYYTRAIGYIINGLLIALIIIIWISEFRSFATFIGLISAALTIALRDAVVNIAGWAFILIRKPFSVGDRITIGAHKGDVIDIRLYQFTINEIGNWVDADQSTGRIIHVPNGKVFTEPQANYTQGFSHIWNEIGVLLTFESDWKKAKKILNAIVVKHAAHFTKNAEQRLIEASKKYMILYSKLTPIVYTTVKDSGVMLTMRYLITPRRRRGSEQEIWEDVLEEFSHYNDIDFAYPTQRVYYNAKEKKGGDSSGPIL